MSTDKERKTLPCGGVAIEDARNWCAYCDRCLAVVGSMGMPRECRELLARTTHPTEGQEPA